MLSRIGIYFDIGKRRVASLFGRGREVSAKSGFCCLSISSKEITLAYLEQKNGKNSLKLLEIIPYKINEGISGVLTAAVKKYRLEGVNCSWVLHHSNYQLLQLDALPVTGAEFQAAIRWKIKSLLPFPIEDAVIDSFSLPIQKTHEPHKMMMVTAARVSYLQTFSAKIIQSGLKLTTIDIPELALRNITALYENDEKATALIYLERARGQLIITYKKVLYFQRLIEFGLESIKETEKGGGQDEANVQLDKIALELQRSFDYYQTQWRQPPISRIFLATVESSSLPIISYLSQHLSMAIQPLDIHEMLASQFNLSIEMQGRFLPVIGGVLRDEDLDHAAAN